MQEAEEAEKQQADPCLLFEGLLSAAGAEASKPPPTRWAAWRRAGGAVRSDATDDGPSVSAGPSVQEDAPSCPSLAERHDVALLVGQLNERNSGVLDALAVVFERIAAGDVRGGSQLSGCLLRMHRCLLRSGASSLDARQRLFVAELRLDAVTSAASDSTALRDLDDDVHECQLLLGDSSAAAPDAGLAGEPLAVARALHRRPS